MSDDDALEAAIDEQMSEILARCGEAGMVEPFIMCIAAANEYFEVWRFNADEEVKTLAECGATELQLPINIMVVDKNGAAFHAVIEGDGAIKFH
jgi:hypothetical protein